MEKKKIIGIGTILCFIMIAGILYSNQNKMFSDRKVTKVSLGKELKDKVVSEESILITKEKSGQKICVHICGFVKRPGVYFFEAGARIFDVIKAAGGCKKGADDAAVNQADVVEDGQQIYIPSKTTRAKKKIENTDEEHLSQQVEAGKVNLNTATLEQLMTLSGIGEGKAKKILEYREKNGPFHTIEDIKKITGIKDGIFQKIKDTICT